MARAVRQLLSLGLALVLASAASASVLAGGLSLGFGATGHGHRLALRSDGAHLDLVLVHAERGERVCERGPAPTLVRAGCCGAPTPQERDPGEPHDDHAVHWSGDTGGQALRAPTPSGVATPTPVAADAAPGIAVGARPQTRANAPASFRLAEIALQRTVVYRI